MARYFINFVKGDDGIITADDEGPDFPGLEAAEAAAMASAREILAGDIKFASAQPLRAVTITNHKGEEIRRIEVRLPQWAAILHYKSRRGWQDF